VYRLVGLGLDFVWIFPIPRSGDERMIAASSVTGHQRLMQEGFPVDLLTAGGEGKPNLGAFFIATAP
jgi:hypothetical protein